MKEYSPEDKKTFLSITEIEQRLKQNGFYEMEWLWKYFRALGVAIDDIDELKLAKIKASHTGALISHPYLMFFISLLVAITEFIFLRSFLLETGPLTVFDTIMMVFFSLLVIYLFWFIMLTIQRVWIHPWKKISALELSSILRYKSFREWFDKTEDALEVMNRLKELGIQETWDKPDYQVYYQYSDDTIKTVNIPTPEEFIQDALRQVLGYKKDRHHQPGRYIESLKDRKKSISRFVNAHQDAISKNREGNLPVKDGIQLLNALHSELISGSAGETFINNTIKALENKDFLPNNVIKASIWNREPFEDLTNSTQFFSSASLRGNRFMDTLERRTKGMLGPFGYLRNKSISALDFQTVEGRSVRARLAAAFYIDDNSKKHPLLFVDAVEGRFTVKPQLIRKAIEDYAWTCGFEMVLYFKYPLNKVPLRFVRHLDKANVPLGEFNIAYIDASRHEYLDAFGLPLEPFEYAFPKGKVIGYVATHENSPVNIPVVPGKIKILYNHIKDKSILWLLLFSSLICLIWMTSQHAPELLIPVIVLTALGIIYDLFIHRKVLAKRQKNTKNEPEPNKTHPPEFLQIITRQIEKDPTALKMSYPDRMSGKIDKLMHYFPDPSPQLRFFFEHVMFNVSIKDSDLVNMLKFLDKAGEKKRLTATRLFGVIWSQSDPDAFSIGLSEDKNIRNKAKKQLFEKIDTIRKFVKKTELAAHQIRQLKCMEHALKADISDILTIVGIQPRILRGLRKPPRPMYAWVFPVIAGAFTGWFLAFTFPNLSGVIIYLTVMIIIILGTYFISTALPVAPGILFYAKTGKYLKSILENALKPSPILGKMKETAINTEEYLRGKTYENKDQGLRIVIRDKRKLDDALAFLVSSEGIGNCIALRNFVSWTLPSLLNDEGIMLADIYYKGSHTAYTHRAQIWMIAAVEAGQPVLVVNSFEFNNEGAKYMNELMPEAIHVLQDVAKRSGYRKIYAGISEFGRDYLDKHFPQGMSSDEIVKIHCDEAGFAYYFDSFQLKGGFSKGKRYRYMKKRGIVPRTYAIIFGGLEFLRGNQAKAQAFFDAAMNVNNFWEIPISVEENTTNP